MFNEVNYGYLIESYIIFVIVGSSICLMCFYINF